MIGASVHDLLDEETLKIVEEVTVVFQEVGKQKGEQLQEKDLFIMIMLSLKAY
jgi:hypothetical protein